jgi:four helix bundle protein
MFSFERLTLYQQALHVVGVLAKESVRWDTRHAVVGQMGRATESIVLNLVEAARQDYGDRKLPVLDYSLGSILESAACCDVALIKSLSDGSVLADAKQKLAEVARMLIGLRKSWSQLRVCEEAGVYDAGTMGKALFPHEELRAYGLAIDVMRWLHASPLLSDLPARLFRPLDEALTALPLNIAEGNGRFARLHQGSFYDMANRRTFQAAARIDLLAASGYLTGVQVGQAKGLLDQVARLTHAMAQAVRRDIPHKGREGTQCAESSSRTSFRTSREMAAEF